MVGEWHDKSFAELVGGRANIIGGPFGSNLTQADYVPHGIPVIRGSNMGQLGRYIGGEFAYVSANKAKQLSSNQVLPGDIVVTQRGTLGQVSLIPEVPNRAYIVSQSQMGVHVLGADPRFVFYLLRSSLFLEFLNGATIQTGVPHINMGLLRDWRVRVPPYREQCQIADVLSAVDDKIELNQRIAKTLEAMARALFKSWFVDFDPVRAKAEDRPMGLSDDLARLFPDSFGGGGLPLGWRLESLPKIAHFLNGLALQKYPANDGEPSLPVIKIAELRSGPTAKSDRASVNLPAEHHVSDGDHLFSWSGSLTHCRWSHGPGALNQHLFKVTPVGFPEWLVYEAVEYHLPEFQEIASGKAVTMGHIQRHHLEEAMVALPPRPLLKALDAVLAPLHERSFLLDLQSRTLSALRNTLLPKLISGELRIAHAEKHISAA